MKKNWLIHDSHQAFYRHPFGAVKCGERIILRIEINSTQPANAVTLRIWKDNSIEEKITMYVTQLIGSKQIYQAEINAPSRPGWLWYYFIIKIGDKTYYYGNNSENLGGLGGIYHHQPPSYQITVYSKSTSTPNWFKDAVMYQIFVDRFYNGHHDGQLLNPKKHCILYSDWHEKPYYRKDPATGKTVCFDFYGGNLLGVIKKLPFLKDLGINVIYFNPIFEAASNHKYDTGDYKKIDSMYGNNELFKRLCATAKELGIYIILDGVFSHTGSDSIYFNKYGRYPELGAYQSPQSPYYSWYKFKHYPDNYECWWGVDTLPNVNEMDPSYQDFIIYNQDSVLRYWIDMGAKGWRLDVVDELPDQFVKGIRQVMKERDQDSVLIGEVWEDASRKVSYGQMRQYLMGDELDSAMNYPFRNALLDYLLGNGDAYQTNRLLMSLYENYPKEHFYSTMNLVGTHDVPRVLTILGEAPPADTLTHEEQKCFLLSSPQKALAVGRLKLLSLVQMTFPGVPCIYYGDEAGVEGYGDPYCRGTYPWDNKNQELFSWYKKIVNIRNQYAVLRTGQWLPIYAHQDVYCFLRIIENERDVFKQARPSNVAVTIINRSVEKEYPLMLDLGKWCQDKMFDLINNKTMYLENGKLSVLVPPLSGTLLIKEQQLN